MNLDPLTTLAAAGLVTFAGYGLRRVIPQLGRWNIPAPVIGGLIVAAAMTLTRTEAGPRAAFDTALQTPLMIAFFTSVGFGASASLLKRGGPQVVILFVAATVVAVLQNVLGGTVAALLGHPPLLGVLAGSVTLTGGPATGLAFAPEFEKAGISGAATLAVAAAMTGIVSGALSGGPIAAWLIRRHRLEGSGAKGISADPVSAAEIVERELPEKPAEVPPGDDTESYVLLKNLVAMLAAMVAGAWVSMVLEGTGAILPAYIGAMLVAAVMRNVDDLTGWIGLSQRAIDDIGNVALSLFLAMALMTLKLWELAGLAVALTVIVAAQVALIVFLCVGPFFRLMGRDYEAAVMSSGFCGFMLGTTANAMANMRAVVERHGPAPRAFLAIPIVGAFFIDFTNALLITWCLTLARWFG